MTTSISATVVLLLGVLSSAASERLEGLWTGRPTGLPITPPISIKLSTNSQGAVMGLRVMEVPGTFSYGVSEGAVIRFTNHTALLSGALRYDARGQVLIYSPEPPLHPLVQGPVVLVPDTNQCREVMLGSILGMTNEAEIISKLFGTITNRSIDWDNVVAPNNGLQPHGAANRSQPVRAHTNQTSSAAGSAR